MEPELFFFVPSWLNPRKGRYLIVIHNYFYYGIITNFRFIKWFQIQGKPLKFDSYSLQNDKNLKIH